MLFLTSVKAADIISKTEGGNWSQPSTWEGDIIPSPSDNVFINGPVLVDVVSYCNNLTVNENQILTTDDFYTGTDIGVLNINGNFKVESGAIVNVGYLTGGRLIVKGSGKTHIIKGTINIGWSMYFDNRDATETTVSLENGAKIITLEAPINGQLFIFGAIVFTVNSGAELINKCTMQTDYLSGIFTDKRGNKVPSLIIYGTFTNYPNGTININDGTCTIHGTFNYPSGLWDKQSKYITYTSTGKLVYNGGNLTISTREWPTTGSPTYIEVKSSGTISLDMNRTISGTLKMTSGNINTGAYTLTLGSGTSNIGTLEYISGNIITGATGGFKRWFANSTIYNVFFPVGTASTINMITLSFTGAPSSGGSLTAKFIPGNPGSPTMEPLYDVGYDPEPNPYMIDRYSQRGYWQLDAGDGLAGGTYNIWLRCQGFNPTAYEITNYTELRVLKRTNGSGNNWTVTSGTHLFATGNNSDPTIRRTGLTGFSQFAMGGNSVRGNPLEGPLPVKLTSFTSIISGRDVKLNWVTEMEENNSGFEVQKSEYKIQESEVWSKIGFVKGNGTKNSSTSYSFEDKNLQTGKYKYRLKQIDYNGNYEYFELEGVIEVGVPKKFDLSQNYPNPFNPVTKINFDIPVSGLVTLKVYDILGKEVASLVNETREAGYYALDFDAGKLASGVYFYRLSSNGFSSVKRLVVLK